MKWLKEREYEIVNKYPGVYNITGKTPFATQIVVTKELDDDSHMWLMALNILVNEIAFHFVNEPASGECGVSRYILLSPGRISLYSATEISVDIFGSEYNNIKREQVRGRRQTALENKSDYGRNLISDVLHVSIRANLEEL